MHKHFQTIAVMSRQLDTANTIEVLQALLGCLVAQNRTVILEHETAVLMQPTEFAYYPIDQIGKQCDLMIVVGGDGSLLKAAQAVVDFDKPILGVNRGNLGFLADIYPDKMNDKLSEILTGCYQQEERFLLTATREKPTFFSQNALNDVVLLPGQAAHMIEFEIFIDQQFVSHQRADGLIIATPTGSTAYALSGGGPILHPDLDAIVLVPMFPHTLSSRPIVVAGNASVLLRMGKSNRACARLSCDGQAYIPLDVDDTVSVTKKKQRLKLIHPLDYDYFETLRAKLHWERN